MNNKRLSFREVERECRRRNIKDEETIKHIWEYYNSLEDVVMTWDAYYKARRAEKYAKEKVRKAASKDRFLGFNTRVSLNYDVDIAIQKDSLNFHLADLACTI